MVSETHYNVSETHNNRVRSCIDRRRAEGAGGGYGRWPPRRAAGRAGEPSGCGGEGGKVPAPTTITPIDAIP